MRAIGPYGDERSSSSQHGEVQTSGPLALAHRHLRGEGQPSAHEMSNSSSGRGDVSALARKGKGFSSKTTQNIDSQFAESMRNSAAQAECDDLRMQLQGVVAQFQARETWWTTNVEAARDTVHGAVLRSADEKVRSEF